MDNPDPQNLGVTVSAIAAVLASAWGAIKVWKVRITRPREEQPDKFDTLYQMLDGRFRQTDSRLEQINVRLERADTKFEDTHRMLHTVIQETGERLKGVEKDVEHIRLDHGRRLENLEHDRG